MEKQTALKIREAKRLYKSALCSPCTFHVGKLADKLTEELNIAKQADSCTLAQYRLTQLITKIQNIKP
jgi:hypothetical protein